MSPDMNELELTERLNLIEAMIAQGRRTCESWGWTFVLWGLAYYVAFFWARWGHFRYAWPVTVVIAAILTTAGFLRRGDTPSTTLGRAIASIWIATGVSMFILFVSLGFSGRLDEQIFIAGASAMLGLANAACSLTLKWKVEFGCALLWWAVVLVASFGKLAQSIIAFLTAIFLCQIVFGTYMMIQEARQRRHGSHA